MIRYRVKPEQVDDIPPAETARIVDLATTAVDSQHVRA